MISWKSVVASFRVLVFLGIAPIVLVTQTVPEQTTIPETGYVSNSRYINAFFGFSLPLPQDADFKDFTLSSKENFHSIFGLQAQRKGLTALTVSATQSTANPTDHARRAAGGDKGASVKRVEIGHKEFWKSESEDEGRGGTMHTLIYATTMSGYTLQFTIVSFDGKLAKQLRHSIESITFVDPSQVKTLAGSDARLFPAKVEVVLTPTHMAQLTLGGVSGNTYTNDTLGFSFQFPAGWVVADKATQEKVVESGHRFVYGNDHAAAREHEMTQQCSRTLLLATQYPEGAKSDDVNPLVGIIAIDSACLPGVHLPISTTDGGAIRQLGTQITGSLAGTPFIGKGQNTISAFVLQNRMLLDLSSGFKVDLPGRKQPLDVFSCVVFTEDKDYWVAWLFMNGSKSELDDLKKNIKIAFLPSGNAMEQK